jgi:hypothetical protein
MGTYMATTQYNGIMENVLQSLFIKHLTCSKLVMFWQNHKLLENDWMENNVQVSLNK